MVRTKQVQKTAPAAVNHQAPKPPTKRRRLLQVLRTPAATTNLAQAKKAPVEKEVVNPVSVKKTPIKKPTVKKVPVKKIPVKKVTVKKPLAEKSVNEQLPAPAPVAKEPATKKRKLSSRVCKICGEEAYGPDNGCCEDKIEDTEEETSESSEEESDEESVVSSGSITYDNWTTAAIEDDYCLFCGGCPSSHTYGCCSGSIGAGWYANLDRSGSSEDGYESE